MNRDFEILFRLQNYFNEDKNTCLIVALSFVFETTRMIFL